MPKVPYSESKPEAHGEGGIIMEGNKMSPALEILHLTWYGVHENASLWSWARLNRCMHTALDLAIEAGFEFGLDDFYEIAGTYRWGWWAGDGEGFYSHAVNANNMSAIKAYEHYRGRKPFITNNVSQPAARQRGRLAIGTHFTWLGEQVAVTSFDDKTKVVVACSYKDRPPRPADWTRLEVKHIYKLTHKELKANTPND
ncbi:hypothetical protein LCGC14_1517360 [marine sediment metagenome]|uniref:Uncharacterized protein n=1 Tax=marine sediment metagenome TaxID=412755 RepID=A0A0F9JKH0_9ZZZZ